MLFFTITTNPVFVMNSDDDISCVREGYINYRCDDNGDNGDDNDNDEEKEIVLNFIEKDGFYAYSEFFSEGDWPDKYYKNGLPNPNNNEAHLPAMYSGIKLKMISGGWCEKLSDLIQTIPDHPFYKKIDIIEQFESDGHIDMLD
jgi:hypothetical protein